MGWKRANPQEANVLIFSRTSIWAPRRMLLKRLHPPTDTGSFLFLWKPAHSWIALLRNAPLFHGFRILIRGMYGTTVRSVSHAWAAIGPDKRAHFFLIRLSSTVLISCDTVRRMLGVSTVVQSAERSKTPPPHSSPPEPFDYSNGLSGTLTHGPRTLQPQLLCRSPGPTKLRLPNNYLNHHPRSCQTCF